MLEMMLSLYLKSLLLSSLVVLLLCFFWFIRRVIKGLDKTVEERRQSLYEGLLMVVMTIPVLSFGILALLVMFSV